MLDFDTGSNLAFPMLVHICKLQRYIVNTLTNLDSKACIVHIHSKNVSTLSVAEE